MHRPYSSRRWTSSLSCATQQEKNKHMKDRPRTHTSSAWPIFLWWALRNRTRFVWAQALVAYVFLRSLTVFISFSFVFSLVNTQHFSQTACATATNASHGDDAHKYKILYTIARTAAIPLLGSVETNDMLSIFLLQIVTNYRDEIEIEGFSN